MKMIVRYFAAALVAAAITTSAFAGECCEKTAKAAKAGKLCEKCTKDACCKEAAKEVATKGDAKACQKCAKAK